MNKIGAAEEKDHKKVRFHEYRRRIYFLLKLLLLASLLYVNYRFSDFLEEEFFYTRILRSVIFFLTSHLLVSLVRIAIVYFYVLRKNLQEREEDNVVLAINRIATLISGAAFIAAVFLLFEITWQTFFTSFSLVAVASVILTKDYISNMVNGMIFMVTDRFVLGDFVKVGNFEGKIINITLSSVHLRTEEGDFVAIPNNTVYAADIINYSRRESGLINVSFDIKPALLKDTAPLMDALESATRDYDKLIQKNSYELIVRNITTDKVQVSFQFYLKTPDPELEREVRQHALQQVSQAIAQLS